MAGIGFAVSLLVVVAIMYVIAVIITYTEGRDDRDGYYDNSYWLILAWAYDAGYTSTWRRKDVAKRNEERFAQREKQNGRLK